MHSRIIIKCFALNMIITSCKCSLPYLLATDKVNAATEHFLREGALPTHRQLWWVQMRRPWGGLLVSLVSGLLFTFEMHSNMMQNTSQLQPVPWGCNHSKCNNKNKYVCLQPWAVKSDCCRGTRLQDIVTFSVMQLKTMFCSVKYDPNYYRHFMALEIQPCTL